MLKINEVDTQYLNLGKDILYFGNRVPTRAKIDGNYLYAYSLFGKVLTFDLDKGFPILTIRKISWKNTVEELIWFLQGNTNIDYLHDKNIHIWDAWTYKNDVGPLYPKQLRSFDNGRVKVDQIKLLIENINKVKEDPLCNERRRLVLTTWNPADFIDLLPNQLYPCHGLSTIFNITNNILSCVTIQRSADYFLGLSQNISSYALLLSILAHITNLQVGTLIYNIADVHIYENHIEQVQELLTRKIHPLPKLEISSDFIDIDNIDAKWFTLKDYKNSGILRGKVAV